MMNKSHGNGCCSKHGCALGEEGCPYVHGVLKSEPCELCREAEANAPPAPQPIFRSEVNNLQQLRLLRGLTQAKVAAALETSAQNVWRLERASNCGLQSLQDFVKALGGELVVEVHFPGQVARLHTPFLPVDTK